jgi:AhpD family alkylhydroperoxidase
MGDAVAPPTPEKEADMDHRLEYQRSPLLQQYVKHLNAAGAVVAASSLPTTVQNLVLLRASQINGCAYCTDMHAKDAEHDGESWLRLNLVAAWHDASVFSEDERAALELTEAGTRIADGATGVSDDVWARAAKHFDDEQLAALVCLIAGINAYNRLNVISQHPGGDYRVGQWSAH